MAYIITIETASNKAAGTIIFYSCFNHSFSPLTSSISTFVHDKLILEPADCPEELFCTEESITELLTNLDVTKSTGCDVISAKMFKSTATSIAPSLATLFNMSISRGTFPSEWKTARIVPIPKGTDNFGVQAHPDSTCSK